MLLPRLEFAASQIFRKAYAIIGIEGFHEVVTPAMQKIERERGQPITEVLIELYSKHHTQQAVADALGISRNTLSVWLIRLGLTEQTVLVPREDKTA